MPNRGRCEPQRARQEWRGPAPPGRAVTMHRRRARPAHQRRQSAPGELKSHHGEVITDAWHPTYEGAPSDSRPWDPDTEGMPGVHRGSNGCWQDEAEAFGCHAAFRAGMPPSDEAVSTTGGETRGAGGPGARRALQTRRPCGVLDLARGRRFDGFVRVPAAAFAGLAASLVCAVALADLGPPPGYVACTAEARRAVFGECYECRASAANSEHCANALAEYGFTWSCGQRSIAAWSEVWCRPVDPKAKAVPASVIEDLADPSGGLPLAGAPSRPAPSADRPAPARELAPALPADAGAPSPRTVPPTSGCAACSVDGNRMSVAGRALALALVFAAWARRRHGRR